MALLPSLLLTLAPLHANSASAAPAVPGRVPAPTDVSKEEALRLAFPGCEIERRVVYLTKEERARANELAGFDVGTSIVHAYGATRKPSPPGAPGAAQDAEPEYVGTAWFDIHVVRTKKELLLFAVDPKSRIRRLEVLAFTEPPEYQPRASWYAQFLGRRLDEDLRLDRGIRVVTGATLTARATTNAARRVLALHRVAIVDRERSEDEGREAR